MHKLFFISLLFLISCSATKVHKTDYKQAGFIEPETFDLNLDQEPSTTNYCASYTLEAMPTKKPVDIIFVIDNSGSMSNKIAAVVSNINVNFAKLIEASGLDYRVIMLTQHGPAGGLFVCIEQPLSTIPVGGCQNLDYMAPPGINPGKFYHYSVDVESTDSFCHILSALTGEEHDAFGLAPNGFISWLRPEAEKIFVEITDDLPMCSWHQASFQEDYFTPQLSKIQADAHEFDNQLTAISSSQFGTPENRKYKFYSIVGMQAKNMIIDPGTGYLLYPKASAFDPYGIQDLLVDERCYIGQASGETYQYLSVMTGGLRFPICYPNGFGAIFNDIASGIINNSDLCNLHVPVSNQGIVDPVSTVVDYYSSGKFKQEFTVLAGNESCVSTSNKFQLDSNLNVITLCQDACNKVSPDVNATLKISANCLEQIR